MDFNKRRNELYLHFWTAIQEIDAKADEDDWAEAYVRQVKNLIHATEGTLEEIQGMEELDAHEEQGV
jgi:hypothetical protein